VRHNTHVNDSQHNDIQYNDTRHKDLQYNISITALMLSVIHAGCQKLAHYAECIYAEYRYAECRGAK
jgi:hypothetical protein